MGTGTIQSMVALSAMQNQWQKKKNDINAGKTSELTSEQRELQMYQSAGRRYPMKARNRRQSTLSWLRQQIKR